ncbi:MAG TPA: potassium-transporting ATPase subunit KdpA [Acidimicrobiales bacterium]|nr:potassium-transporting ATPase subunit KdpA [Acidimicrobiales bacterium]
MGLFASLAVLVAALALSWRLLGSYLAAVYDGRLRFLGFLERPLYRILGVDPEAEQSWQRYAGALVVFSGVSILLTYLVERIQSSLPLNPEHLASVPPALAWNTAVSFVTNTNWQNYAGESTMSYLTQMAALGVQQFASASVGIAVAVALARGFARRGAPTIGNFWVDLVRGVCYVLVPVAFLAGIVYVEQGAVQTLAGPATVHDALTGATQVIARGPVGFLEAIKNLGTNGGGFFNANGAHPFENPTALTNLLSVFLMLCIPVSLTYTFGKMVGSTRQGVALLMAMAVIFAAWLGFTTYAETRPNPAVAAAHAVAQPQGNVEGKEVRFGVLSSALYDVTATQTSTGSVDGSNDSYTPMGGFGLLSGMMLGEVSPGGVGSGLYTILLFAVVTVFIGGLMVGRTPEYLRKKIQAREVKLAAIAVLVMPLTVIVATAIAVSVHAGRIAPSNAGPHGFSEILYAFTSQANNNGSAFAGLRSDTPFYDVAGAISMLLGRFGVIVPVLALAGSLAGKQLVPTSRGTLRTDTPLFVGLLIAVILIVGGLTFFPAVSLGPIVEQLSHGRLF